MTQTQKTVFWRNNKRFGLDVPELPFTGKVVLGSTGECLEVAFDSEGKFASYGVIEESIFGITPGEVRARAQKYDALIAERVV